MSLHACTQSYLGRKGAVENARRVYLLLRTPGAYTATRGTPARLCRLCTESRNMNRTTTQPDEWPGSLKPFVHQVTGRSHILTVNSTTLCKSLLPRELLFYTSIPDDLRPFVPYLKGVLYAQLEECQSGDHHSFSTRQVFVKPSPSQIKEVNNNCEHRTNAKEADYHWTDAYEKVLFKGLERVKYDMTSGFKSHPWTIDKDAEAVVESMGANPWAVRQHRREINRMLSLDGSSQYKKRLHPPVDADGNRLQDQDLKLLTGYLMLEDVSAGFRHPNIMDFKLGRQIERDNCSQEKKNKHAELAKNSSTGTLMLRIAGMQVYQANSGHYLCRDKYYGRGLSSSGFIEAIRQFLHNGERLLVEVVPPIVRELSALRSVLAKQDTFRFYASSLLILFEGDDCRSQKYQNGHENGNTNGENGVSSPETCTESRKIVVKMIDFAHSTYQGFNGDRTLHIGPDHDCLEGITNLIEILEDITDSTNSSASTNGEL